LPALDVPLSTITRPLTGRDGTGMA